MPKKDGMHFIRVGRPKTFKTTNRAIAILTPAAGKAVSGAAAK